MIRQSELVDLLARADSYGILSIRQLQVFISHAAANGQSIAQVTGLSPDDEGYKHHQGVVRRLMLGEPHRGCRGHRLLRFGSAPLNKTRNKERSVLMTPRGRKLWEALALAR